MPSALVGAASCAACAAALPAGAVECPRCATRVVPPAAGSAVAGSSGALVGVTRAGLGRRRAAVAADAVTVLAAGALVAIVALPSGLDPREEIPIAAVLGIAAALIALTIAVAASGRSPGRLLLRLRTVDNLSGLPPRAALPLLAAVVGLTGRTTVTADLAAGRDPLARTVPTRALPQPTTWSAPAQRRQPPEIAMARELLATQAEGVVARLRSDSGDELVVAGPVLVGRQPEPTAAVRAVHAVPDLSRTMARTHALLDWSEGLLWITDLGGAGGTEVVARDGTRQPLVPGVRTAAAAGWRVRMGRRTFEVRTTQRVRPARQEVG